MKQFDKGAKGILGLRGIYNFIQIFPRIRKKSGERTKDFDKSELFVYEENKRVKIPSVKMCQKKLKLAICNSKECLD